MDGYSRTCIEWMCNEDYEPGSFDLKNIMSPPDHESMFMSLINANPLAEEETAGGPSLAAAAQLSGAAPWRRPSESSSAAAAAPSLVSLVQQLHLTADGPSAPTSDASRPGGADPGSVVAAASEALSSAADGATSGGNLPRVTSASGLDSMAIDLPAAGGRERRMSISCPNTPPAERRARHPYFTESMFDPARPSAITRAWQQQQGATTAAAAGEPLRPEMADRMDAGAPAVKRGLRPKPNRLRELNFIAPTSM